MKYFYGRVKSVGNQVNYVYTQNYIHNARRKNFGIRFKKFATYIREKLRKSLTKQQLADTRGAVL